MGMLWGEGTKTKVLGNKEWDGVDGVDGARKCSHDNSALRQAQDFVIMGHPPIGGTWPGYMPWWWERWVWVVAERLLQEAE
jgi:hypothetical protein